MLSLKYEKSLRRNIINSLKHGLYNSNFCTFINDEKWYCVDGLYIFKATIDMNYDITEKNVPITIVNMFDKFDKYVKSENTFIKDVEDETISQLQVFNDRIYANRKITKLFDDCDAYIDKTSNIMPILFKKNNENVGVVMPIKVNY